MGQELSCFGQINVFFLVQAEDVFPERHSLRPVLAEEVLGVLFCVLQDLDDLGAVPVVDVGPAQQLCNVSQ